MRYGLWGIIVLVGGVGVRVKQSKLRNWKERKVGRAFGASIANSSSVRSSRQLFMGQVVRTEDGPSRTDVAR